MKHRFFKYITTSVLVCTLLISLTGCKSIGYRKAVGLYNAGSYEAAAELFYDLGDYKDSTALHTDSQYWAAVTLAEAGNYSRALPRFLKLGDYQNAADWAAECKYQLAVAAFDSGEFDTAKADFLENPDYRQAREYLRRIAWQSLFDAVVASGSACEGLYVLQAESSDRLCVVTADTAQPNRLIFSVSRTKDMGYRFYDDLSLILSRDQTQAAFTGSSTFTMDFGEDQIGSWQTASGMVDICVCTAETVLVPDRFTRDVTDNHGNTVSFSDPEDCRMEDLLAENLAVLLEAVPELLRSSGITQTLAEIGFAAS